MAMGPNFWLACLAVFQVTTVSMTYFSALIWLLGPITFLSFMAVFLAIFFQWKKGIHYFMALSFLLLVLNVVPMMTIIFQLQATLWHRVLIYLFQSCLQLTCLYYGWLVLSNMEASKRQSTSQAAAGESQGLLGKAKGFGGKLKTQLVRPFKS
mmetsp:Transcript_19638/g.30764  ORF Transcript_19638/g.30764 Transcript_19638/m.30764 type:complete len:153 (+) Transcript_19638:163-621(+)